VVKVRGSLGVPHAGGAVPGTGDDPLAVRAVRHANHTLGVPLEYVERLPAIAQVRQGTNAIRPAGLFG